MFHRAILLRDGEMWGVWEDVSFEDDIEGLQTVVHTGDSKSFKTFGEALKYFMDVMEV